MTAVFSGVFTDNRPPDLSAALHTIFEEQLPEPEINRNNVILVSYFIHPIPAEIPFLNRHELYLKDILGIHRISM